MTLEKITMHFHFKKAKSFKEGRGLSEKSFQKLKSLKQLENKVVTNPPYTVDSKISLIDSNGE